ncbi:MAG: adenylylsulfate kinase, partial [Mobilitalea sp.]
GKSEIGSLLSYYFNSMGIGSYILSGDNYPHRIPKYNDAERLRVYRESGLKGLVASREFTKERNVTLQQLQESGKDSDADLGSVYSWITYYQEAGKNGLETYLGTANEIDFEEVNNIIAEFKNNYSNIMLKRMGREEKELWYDSVDFSAIQILIIEWTHGNNSNLKGIDIPILLNSTPKETLEHRRLRNRDGAIDSSFTMEVLNIEQKLLSSQAPKAKIIVTKNGQIISYEELNQMI